MKSIGQRDEPLGHLQGAVAEDKLREPQSYKSNMLFVRNWVHLFVMEVLSVLVKLNDIFVFSSWHERFASGPQAGDGRDVKQSRRKHTIRKVEAVSRPLPKIEGRDKKIGTVSQTNCWKLN